MVANKRKFRYVASSRNDGYFALNFFPFQNHEVVQIKSEERRLELCMYCLSELNWQDINSRRKERFAIRAGFDLKKFFTKYPKNILQAKDTQGLFSDKNAPLNQYSQDWAQISRRLRAEVGYICQRCGKDYSQNKQFLDVHHKNGLKYDNSKGNLEVLCKSCHSKEFAHEHLKTKLKDLDLPF